MKKKIVVLDGYGANPGDLSWEGMKLLGDLSVYPRTASDEIIDRVGDAEMILTNKVVLDADKLAVMKCLRYIGVLATGFNVVDIEAAKSLGITVTNIPAYSTDSVAQMTFAHILNFTNHVGNYAHKNRNGRWSYNQDFCYWDSPLHELAKKTIGIVGLGHIGSIVARIANDFGMDVFAYTSKNVDEMPGYVKKTTLDGLFSISDFLTLHCPLTDSTRELINHDTLKKMKHGTILINTARGSLVNENDVAEALKCGQLAGYGADVMCQEPPLPDNPLFAQPNACITPHVGWATFEARERLMAIAIANVKAFLEGKPVNVVNH